MRDTVYSCCVHTHTSFCDGSADPETVAAAAFAAGVRHLGFSGHSHTPIDYDRGSVLSPDAGDYLAEISRLRSLYAGRMEILPGMEWDACSDAPPPPGLDYWIGSVHNIPAEDGRYYSVDWRREDFTACRDELFAGDVYAMAAAYYARVGQVAAMKPSILGHIDLISKLNVDGSLFDESAPAYIRAALAALERADSRATLLEINTGAVARGYRREPYPAPFLLEAWREMGGRVIITSDAHRPEQLLFGYEMAAGLAKAAGYRAAAILTADGIKECEL